MKEVYDNGEKLAEYRHSPGGMLLSQRHGPLHLRHTHLASVRKDLLTEFRRRFEVVNYLAWVREMASAVYGVDLNDLPDIQTLSEAIDKDYYRDIGEWLSEAMRNALVQGHRCPLCLHQPTQLH